MKAINDLKATSSLNEKRIILESNKDNKLLQDILYLSYSPRIKFYIKEFLIPETDESIELEESIRHLSRIYNREVTGNEAREILNDILSKTKEQDILAGIVNKSQDIGIGTREIKKAFPDLIETPPYMGAVPYSDKRIEKLFKENSTLFAQLKVDGRYANVSKDIIVSRAGLINQLPNCPLLKEIESLPSGIILNGELTIQGVDRHISNGIIASLIDIESKEGKSKEKSIKKFNKEHGQIEDYIDRIYLTAWDILTDSEYKNEESQKHYDNRLKDLEEVIKNFTYISVVEYKLVNNKEELIEYFSQVIKEEQEGLVVKTLNGTWKSGKPTWQVKMKIEVELDLIIKGFNYGTGKNKEVYSTINLETSCGKMKVTAGGLKESTMQRITDNPEEYIDTIATIKCNGLSKDSLLHPSVIAFRDDKETANSLEECIDIQASVLTA